MKSLAILGSRGIPATYGGFETFAEEVATGITANGGRVTVFCEHGDSNIESYKGVKLEYVNTKLRGVLRTIVIDLKGFLAARKKYDVVYMLGYGAALFAFLPRIYGKEVWINMDGLEWSRKKWDYFPAKQWFLINEWLAVKFATKIIADASSIRDYLEGKYNNIKDISVIEYGATVPAVRPDKTHLERYSLNAGEYDIVVCRLEPENHVMEIIKAYSNSKDNLVIVGGIDKQTPYIKKLLNEAPDSIRFLGAIYEKPILEALRFHSRLYVHGHSVGGTNPSLLEAMAMGNLIVAHDNTFNREVLSNAGFYFSDDNSLRYLLENVNSPGTSSMELGNMRELAVETVRQYYTWGRIVSAYTELL